MRSRFKFPKDDVLEYAKFLGVADAESEWLFLPAFMQRFVDECGEEVVLKSKTKVAGEYRYDFTPPGKQMFPVWLASNAKAADFARWRPVLDALVAKLATV
jgi:hypothetical protein